MKHHRNTDTLEEAVTKASEFANRHASAALRASPVSNFWSSSIQAAPPPYSETHGGDLQAAVDELLPEGERALARLLRRVGARARHADYQRDVAAAASLLAGLQSGPITTAAINSRTELHRRLVKLGVLLSGDRAGAGEVPVGGLRSGGADRCGNPELDDILTRIDAQMEELLLGLMDAMPAAELEERFDAHAQSGGLSPKRHWWAFPAACRRRRFG